jgi:hypothetical protein
MAGLVGAVLLAVLAQAQVPTVSVAVDRLALSIGETLVVTITAAGVAGAPLEIVEAGLDGFSVVNRRDRTRVTTEQGIAVRTTLRELTLRAERSGSHSLGPFRVSQLGGSAATDPVVIQVAGPAAASTITLSPRVRSLVDRVPPPALSDSEDVGLTATVVPESAQVGQQIDVLIVAWFPRSIRNRLRSPPILRAPNVRGSWTYPETDPVAVVAGRRVGRVIYDLFVLHQVVFPLTPGALLVEPAVGAYSLPISGSFLARELRQEERTEAVTVPVAPLPSPPAGVTFTGAVGRKLTVRATASSREVRLGDAATVIVEVEGIGNVSLWPEPELRWPAGVQAYQQRVTIEPRSTDGIIGGTKRYEYLIVPDSAGAHRLPAPGLTYWDGAQQRFRTVAAEAIEFVTPGGAGRVAPVRMVPALMRSPRVPSIDRLVRAIPWWAWGVFVVLPPLLVLGRLPGTRAKVRSLRPRRIQEPAAGTLVTLEADLRSALASLVPDAHLRAGDDLAAALRAAGTEDSLAAHAARLRDRLRLALYGPDGTSDADELRAEGKEVLRALAGESQAPHAGLIGIGVMLLLVAAPAPPLAAQAPEQLWETGAVRLVVDSFAGRVRTEPGVAAHWFNLGTAWGRLGEEARARAAWHRAARLAPRNDRIREALASLPPTDSYTRAYLWTSIVTPAEALVVAGTCWLLAWLLLAAPSRRRYGIVLLAIAALAAGYGLYAETRYREPVAFVLHATPLRAAPYGPAAANLDLLPGLAVRVRRSRGAWHLVEHGGARGWVLRWEVVRL